MNPWPTLNYVYSVLIHEKNQRAVSRFISSCLDEPTTAVMLSNGEILIITSVTYNVLIAIKKCYKVDKCWKKFGASEEVRKRWNTTDNAASANNMSDEKEQVNGSGGLIIETASKGVWE